MEPLAPVMATTIFFFHFVFLNWLIVCSLVVIFVVAIVDKAWLVSTIPKNANLQYFLIMVYHKIYHFPTFQDYC